MYLHLGGNAAVPFKNIVGFFDMDTSTVSKHTRAFLEKSEKNNRIINISDELPRSFIVCVEDGKETVYLSQISAQTLLKRADTEVSLGNTKNMFL